MLEQPSVYGLVLSQQHCQELWDLKRWGSSHVWWHTFNHSNQKGEAGDFYRSAWSTQWEWVEIQFCFLIET